MKVLAPGKLILSGEHAVVYGKPALAMAVNRYVTATVSKQFLPFVSFDLSDLSYRDRISITALKRLKSRIKEKYQLFIRGDFKIREVLHKPMELAQFALSLFFEMLNIKLSQGIKIHVSSDIPMGCGMGSSAATILGIVHALAHHLDIKLTQDMFYRLGLEAENMQHGFSSGLDLRVSLEGGCVYVADGEIHKRSIPVFPMYLINTGIPESTTGECVERASRIFKSSSIADDFGSVTSEMDVAISQHRFQGVSEAIKANHRLLTDIGVVPEQVGRFIADIQKLGGAGKVCGAGAVSGQRAGMVLITIDDPAALVAACARYNYHIIPVAGESRGVHVV